MFIDELSPIVKELGKQPLAFMGGLFTGVFRLDLSEDPLRSWLENQGANLSSQNSNSGTGKEEGPQSIPIEE